ncbi:MAG: hypothetical protein WA160_01290 [Pseudobdellovibrio sp.]
MKKIKIITIGFLLVAFSNLAFADSNFRSYSLGRIDTEVTVNYFKTDSNFSTSGSKVDLPSGFTYQVINFTPEVRYVVLPDFGISAGLNVGSAESSDTIATRRNSSLNKIFIGADYLLYNTNWLSLMTEFSYTQVLEKVKIDTDTVLNSDGANEIIALISSVINYEPFYPFFKGGIKYRTEGLSSLFLYIAGIETRFSDFSLGGLATGYISIKDDDLTSTSSTREILTNRVDAYSKKYDSINPNLLDSEFYLKYNFSKDLAMKAFAGYTILGSNTAMGLHAGFSAQWSFGGDSIRTSHPKEVEQKRQQVVKPLPPVIIKKAVPIKTNPTNSNGFKEDVNDGVNQDYFKPVTPSNEEYIEQIEGSSKSLKNATDPEPTDDMTVKQIDSNSGYQIKLKKIKKKKK